MSLQGRGDPVSPQLPFLSINFLVISSVPGSGSEILYTNAGTKNHYDQLLFHISQKMNTWRWLEDSWLKRVYIIIKMRTEIWINWSMQNKYYFNLNYFFLLIVFYDLSNFYTLFKTKTYFGFGIALIYFFFFCEWILY